MLKPMIGNVKYFEEYYDTREALMTVYNTESNISEVFAYKGKIQKTKRPSKWN